MASSSFRGETRTDRLNRFIKVGRYYSTMKHLVNMSKICYFAFDIALNCIFVKYLCIPRSARSLERHVCTLQPVKLKETPCSLTRMHLT